jgi:DUF1365 family protein
VVHALRYRLFQIFLDLDEGPPLGAASRIFGFNRPALLSFRETDHGDGSEGPLKAQIEARVEAAGLAAGGAVRVFCLPRVLGFVFNPITVYFCHDAAGALSAMVYEVNNTFGNRTFYVLPAAGETVRHRAAKAMHVSPFMDMDLDYDFALDQPGDKFGITIRVARGEELLLTASFHGRRKPFTDGALLRAWASHPLLTLKVVAGIHWEALKLWRKGLKFRSNPHADKGMVSRPA